MIRCKAHSYSLNSFKVRFHPDDRLSSKQNCEPKRIYTVLHFLYISFFMKSFRSLHTLDRESELLKIICPTFPRYYLLFFYRWNIVLHPKLSADNTPTKTNIEPILFCCLVMISSLSPYSKWDFPSTNFVHIIITSPKCSFVQCMHMWALNYAQLTSQHSNMSWLNKEK